MSLLEEIKSREGCVPSFKEGWIESSNETPAHTFHTFFYYRRIENLIICFVCRNYKKKEMIAAFMECLMSLGIDSERDKGIQKSRLPTGIKIEAFTSVIVLKPSYHTHLLKSSTSHASILNAFPCYNCEFSGDESINEFRYIQKRTVCTINWKRAPSPKIKMRFNNAGTKAGTKGNTYVIMSQQSMENEIGNLINSPSSFLEIENYCGKKLLLETQGSQIYNGSSLLDLSQALDLARQFIS